MRKIFLAGICLFVSVSASAQIPGPNVNMVTGKKFPGGDPWLQKQNEPSGAVSTRNPCRLLVGANDYRAVNLPGLPGDKEIGDAWVGWYTSINCGQTFYSTLVPGFPQDQTAAGKSSPAYGLTSAADPTVRAGVGGFFAYSYQAFNRGSNVGKLLVARFLDKNTTEAVTKPETAISYIDTKAWDSGSAGNFIDKPTLAITQGTGTCTLTVAGKTHTIPASTVHLAWTVFVGNNDDVIRTKVYYARSSNCGATLDGPATKLSEGYAVTQSASIAVAPNGTVYVVWRQFSTPKGDQNQILVAKSVDGGKSFTKGTPILPTTLQPFLPFDQGTTSKSFRTNAFPATAIDQSGRLYVALAVRGFANANQSRIVVMSTDGTNWTMPQAIENSASVLPGHQIMPAMTAVGGNLNVVWLDFRDDVSGEYHDFIKEIYPIRHTMDVRGAQAPLKADGTLLWTTYGILQDALPSATAPRISKYLVGDYQDKSGDTFLKQLQFNRSNLKLYAGGTRPFIGDFIDVAGLGYIPQHNSAQVWLPNDGSIPLTAAQTYYAFWTDNRDAKVGTGLPEPPDSNVIPPPEGTTLGYNPPVISGSCPDPALTKTRNANVYTSRITPGVFVAAPTNSKPSIINNNTGARIQRAFPVLVQNRTNKQRTFTLTIANQPTDFPATGIATFELVHKEAYSNPPTESLPAAVLSTQVTIPANSAISRTVFVVSTVKYPQIRVNVDAIVVGPDEPLTGSTILNADIENADIENADIENGSPQSADIENKELHNADIENADIENADIENADIENADIENADIENADIENADIENADIENADIENADIENADIENADIENADIENADIENGAVTDFSVDLKNEGNTASSYQVKFAVGGNTGGYVYQLIGRRVYKTPSANGCIQSEKAQNQILFNITDPDISSAALPDSLSTSVSNATILVAPGETIKVTLRAIDKDGATILNPAKVGGGDGSVKPFCPIVDTVGANCPVVTNPVTVLVRASAPDTGSNTPFEVQEVVSGTLTIATTSLPGAIVGSSYGPKTLQVSAGTAPFTWSLQSGSLPAGLTLDSSSGTLSGIATTPGTSTFVVKVQDASSNVATRTFTITAMGFAAGSLLVGDGTPDTTTGKLYSVSPAGSVQLVASIAGRPQAVAQDGNSFIVIDRTNLRVLRVTPGNVQTLYKGAPLQGPVAVAVTAAGDIVIGDNVTDTVYKLSNGSMTTIGTLPSSPTELQNVDIVVEPSGAVIVANDEATSSPVTLIRIDPFGEQTSVTTTVDSSGAIAIHSSGDYLIADYTAGQIRRVTAAGVTVSSIGVSGIGTMTGMAIDPDQSMYVSVLGAAVRHVPTGGGFTTIASGSPFVMLTDIVQFRAAFVTTAASLPPAVYDSGPGTGGGRPYRQVLKASGIIGTPTWTVDACASCTGLPFGLSLSSAGIISGTPDAHQPAATPPPPDAAERTTYTFTARVTGSSGGSATRQFTLPIHDFFENMTVNAPATAGVNSPFSVTVGLRDGSNAVIPGALVHLQMTNNAGGATPFDLTAITNSEGNATFWVTIDAAGTGYTLVAWAPGSEITVSNISAAISVGVAPPPGVSGQLTFNSPSTVIGSWTQNVAQTFELTVNMTTHTTSLSIDGSPIANAQNVAFTPTTLSTVSVELGTTGTQHFAWDDIVVRNEAGTTTIFSDDFTGDPVNQPPDAPVVGSWFIANLNGSVVVRSASGNLLSNPVELAQAGGTNSVRLEGTLSSSPTTGIWKIQWRSLMADPGTGYPGFIFAPVVVRGNGGVIASVEYR